MQRKLLLGERHCSLHYRSNEGRTGQELGKQVEKEGEPRRPDLFMNAEIPRGSLGVPKHQRDCVPSRRYSITELSEYPHPYSTLLPKLPDVVVLHCSRARLAHIEATGHRHANECL